MLTECELLLHGLVEARLVDGVAVNDVVLAGGVDDIIILQISLRFKVVSYGSHGVHGSSSIERDHAFAGGRVKDIDLEVVGDGDQETLLEMNGWMDG